MHAALRDGRLEVRAGRLVAAEVNGAGASVTLRPRGAARLETLAVDQVILCTGPAADPSRSPSRLVQALVAAGWLTADAAGCGLRVDVRGHPIDANDAPIERFFYLGPWLRARDWEATAVAELRRAATALVEALLEEDELQGSQMTARGDGGTGKLCTGGLV